MGYQLSASEQFVEATWKIGAAFVHSNTQSRQAVSLPDSEAILDHRTKGTR